MDSLTGVASGEVRFTPQSRPISGPVLMSANDAVDGSHQRIAMCQTAVAIYELREGEPPMSEVAT